MDKLKEIEVKTPEGEIKVDGGIEIKTPEEKIFIKNPEKEVKIKTPDVEVSTGHKTIIKLRKEKVLNFLKRKWVWVAGVLIIALILGIYIRSIPMHVRPETGLPGLWDITTNTWTLGPDLDPWLFTRYAETIAETGSLPKIDWMRFVPMSFDTTGETRLLPYMIAYTYKFSLGFLDNVKHAAVIFPVIMFGLTIIAFFLFVREIFVRKNKESETRANIIALISTFFMITIPIFLSRTIAGIPEKESAGFFFMFLSFYLFLKAWKSENARNSYILAGLAGISTAMMGLVWGGVLYVFVTIAIASLIAFILNKVHRREFIIYSLWIVPSFIFMFLLSARFSFLIVINSLDAGLAFLVFFIMLIDLILWNTRIKNIKFFRESKIPKNIISLIIAVIFIILLGSVLFGPGFIFEKISAVNKVLFKPIVGRWNTTVAENRQPYFNEWAGNFGPFLKNIPVLFWLFFIGSVVLFKKMLKSINKKEAWILTGLYVLFFIGLVFSRYAPHPHLLDGENFISKFIYYGSALLLVGFFINYYIKDKEFFKKVRFEYLFLFALFALCLITARSAVRLIMVLGPIAPIFVSFLIVESVDRFRKIKTDTWKIILGVLIILILGLSLFIFLDNYKTIKGGARGMIPSAYNQQWQMAMSWVRNNTAEDAVFAHWWDYGYWVQSIGNRATVLDGANIFSYWNYLMGRHVLTGDNQKDSLEFLYNHNASYLLVDSSDIGKYGAFSSIGSDENYDRYSWIPTSLLDNSQVQESSEGKIRVYQFGSAIDEDIVYESNGSRVFLPGGAAAIGGVILESIESNESVSLKQPSAVFFNLNNNQQITIPLRYIYFNGHFQDFGSGLEGTAYIAPRVFADGRVDNFGGLVYISPRVTRGFFGQKYLLDDPFNKFPNFKTAYIESNFVVKALRSNGVDIGEFVFFQGLEGPIKIWKIEYSGEEQIREAYIDTDPSKYITWEL